MNRAEEHFFEALNGTLEKDAQLSPETVQALNIKDPQLLDQLEGEASERPKPPKHPASPEEEPQEEEPQEELQPEQPAGPVEQVKVKAQETEETLQIPKTLFKDTKTHPLRLAAVLRFLYGAKWIDWVPETLWETIRRDIGAISSVSRDKVSAMSVAASTDSPWVDWTVFENCGKAFNDLTPLFGHMQPLSPAEVAFTLKVLKGLNDFEFSDEVLGYIASVCLYNGIIYAPKKLFGRVQWLVDKQSKNPELKTEIEQAWSQLKDKDLIDIEFNDSKMIDVHVAKLWAVQEYLRDKQSSLRGS